MRSKLTIYWRSDDAGRAADAHPRPWKCDIGLAAALAGLALSRLALSRLALSGLALSGLALPGPALAAGPSDTTPVPVQKPALLSNPGDVLAGMAAHLDQNPGVVVVTVDTLPITQGDVANVIRTLPASLGSLGPPDIYRHAMDVLVRQKVMVLNARKLGLDKDPVVIQQGKVAFERILADAWLTRKSDAAVTEGALHARYDRDIAGKPGPDEVRARVILVPTDAEARGLIDKLRNGADFADLARQSSKDPTAAAGGDLGYLPREAVSPEVGSVMFALLPGQVSPYPVTSVAGYFVLRVEGRRQRATPTFDEARPQLEHELRNEAVREAITSLLTEVKIVPATTPAALPK